MRFRSAWGEFGLGFTAFAPLVLLLLAAAAVFAF